MPLYNPASSSGSGLTTVSNIFPFTTDAAIFNGPNYGNYNSMAVTANRLYMVPVFLVSGRTYTTIVAGVTTGIGASTVYLGLYAANQTNGQPGILVAGSGGAQSSATSATNATETISYVTTYTGWYYLGVLASAAVTLASVSTIMNAVSGVTVALGAATVNAGIFRAFGSAGPLGTAGSTDETGNTFSKASGIQMPFLGIR